MAGDEARGGAHRARPARAAARQRARVVAPAVDDHERVAGVRVDRDAAARAGLAPALEAGGVERAREQPAGGERVADRARAVIAARRAAVAAAPHVGRAGDLVRRGDDARTDVPRTATRPTPPA